MIPKDKFGNPIYDHIYAKLFVIGMRLEKLGYDESTKKPNLFYKKSNGVVFFADMRGTMEVPIWEDPSPLFYYKDDTLKNRDIIVREWKTLIENGCRPRISFEADEQYMFDCIEGLEAFRLINGTCESCGKKYYVEEKDHQGYCSDECQQKAYDQHLKEEWGLAKFKAEMVRCSGCDKHPKVEEDEYGHPRLEIFDDHHINYLTDKKVKVCKQCHGKITRKEKGFEHLFPIGTINDLKKRKKDEKLKKEATRLKKTKENELPQTRRVMRHKNKRPDLTNLWSELLEKKKES